MTTENNSRSFKEALRAGANDIVAKPLRSISVSIALLLVWQTATRLTDEAVLSMQQARKTAASAENTLNSISRASEQTSQLIKEMQGAGAKSGEILTEMARIVGGFYGGMAGATNRTETGVSSPETQPLLSP